MDEINDELAARAHRARASLVAESARHPVPLPFFAGGARRARGSRAIPVLAGLAVVALTVGFLVVSSWRSHSVVVPNVMSTVSAGSRPVAVVTDGGTTFVADTGPGAVTAFSTAKLTASWSHKDATRPIALALGKGNPWRSAHGLTDAATTVKPLSAERETVPCSDRQMLIVSTPSVVTTWSRSSSGSPTMKAQVTDLGLHS